MSFQLTPKERYQAFATNIHTVHTHPQASVWIRDILDAYSQGHVSGVQFAKDLTKAISGHLLSLKKKRETLDPLLQEAMVWLCMLGLREKMEAVLGGSLTPEKMWESELPGEIRSLMQTISASRETQEAVEHVSTRLRTVVDQMDILFAPYGKGVLQRVLSKTGYMTLDSHEGTFAQSSKPLVVFTCFYEDFFGIAMETAKSSDVDVVYLDDADTLYQYEQDGALHIPEGALVTAEGISWVKIQGPLRPQYLFAGCELKPELPDAMTASLPLVDVYTENKEVTSLLLQERHVPVPAFLPFLHHVTHPMLARLLDEGVLYLHDPEHIRETLSAWIGERGISKFVLKPTDGQSGEGVRFFDAAQIEDAAQYLQGLSKDGRNVICEEFVTALPVEIEGTTIDWNVRVFVAKDGDRFVASDMVVRYDAAGKPVNLSLTAKAMTFEQMAQYLDMSETVARDVRHAVESVATDAAWHMEDIVRSREGVSGSQDAMGVDIIVTDRGPVVLELNDHLSGGQYNLDMVQPMEKRGSAVRMLAKRIVARATEKA